MTYEKKPHSSFWQYKDNQVVRLGDVVRLRSEAHWHSAGGATCYVPAGTLGEVKAFSSKWGAGVAIDFGNFNHPDHGVFPMALHTPGASRYSDDFELISRKAVPDAEPPVSRYGMQQPPEAWESDVPRGLGARPEENPEPHPQGGGKGLRKPGAQGRGPAGAAHGPRKTRPQSAPGVSL